MMSGGKSTRISVYLRGFGRLACCLLLLVKNFVLRRRLDLAEIQLGGKKVLANEPIQVFWRVHGCHRININDYTIPGNAKGAEVFTELNSITVTFFGIRDRVEVVANIRRVFLRQVIPTPNSISVPDVRAVQPATSDFNTELPNVRAAFDYQAVVSASLRGWKVDLPDVRINTDEICKETI